MTIPARLAPRIRAAELALKHLQRAIRLRSLYFEGHPSVGQALDQAHEALCRFHERFGALEVEMQPTGVYYSSVRIVMESAQASDLGAALHREGIEVAAFEKGTGRDELEAFASVMGTVRLAASEDEADFADDLLSALWRCDFRNIHYKVTDALSPSSLEASLGNEALGAVAARIKALATELGGGTGQALDEGTFLEELDALREAGELDDLVDWETKDVVAASADEVTPARAELLSRIPAHDELLERAVGCLTWACQEQDDREAAAELAGATFPAENDLVRFLAGASSHLLLRGDVAGATSMVDRATTLDGPTRSVAGPTREELGSRRGMKRFVTGLGKSTAQPEALSAQSRSYLGSLGEAPVGSLCATFATIQDPALKGLIRDYLSDQVSSCPGEIASLTLERDEVAVRTGIELLTLGGVESEAYSLLEEASRDSERPLRAQLAQEAVDELSGERERRELLALLRDSPRAEERVGALQRLLEIPAPSAFPPLEAIASAPTFVDAPAAEQDAVLKALVSIGGVRSVKVLQDLASRSALLFKRNEIRRVASGARQLLESLRGEEAAR